MADKTYTWFTGNPEDFKFTEFELAGDTLVLIIPKDSKAVCAPWYENDKRYRSSIWRVSDGYPVSLGYKKFVNYGEIPEFEPVSINDKIDAIEKVDGTCLICSKYKGEYIFRTRGTTSTTCMDNADEIEPLIQKNQVREMLDDLGEGHTVIFEWVSPRNVLCIRYQEPKLYLTGIVVHENYSYWKQNDLDNYAILWNVERPRRFVMDKLESGKPVNCDSISEEVKTWIGQEGIVAYFGDEQQVLKKMKSNWHHHLHVARCMIGNTRKLITFLYDNEALGKDGDINDVITKKLEWEVTCYYEETLKKVYDGKSKFYQIVNDAKNVVSKMSNPYEILEYLKSGAWTEPETYIWTAFRNKTHRRSFVIEEITRFSGINEEKEINVNE